MMTKITWYYYFSKNLDAKTRRAPALAVTKMAAPMIAMTVPKKSCF